MILNKTSAITAISLHYKRPWDGPKVKRISGIKAATRRRDLVGVWVRFIQIGPPRCAMKIDGRNPVLPIFRVVSFNGGLDPVKPHGQVKASHTTLQGMTFFSPS